MDMQKASDRELLERLIGAKAAEKLYQGSLVPLFAGEARTSAQRRLQVAKELVTRLLYEDLRREEILLTSPEHVKRYLLAYFVAQEYESFLTLFLDAQNRLIASEELFRGTLSQTSVYPREIVKRALRHNAAALIFAHNHPSGVSEPSRADELLTSALKQALGLVDVKVLDHFVVAGTDVVSLAERGMV